MSDVKINIIAKDRLNGNEIKITDPLWFTNYFLPIFMPMFSDADRYEFDVIEYRNVLENVEIGRLIAWLQDCKK